MINTIFKSLTYKIWRWDKNKWGGVLFSWDNPWMIRRNQFCKFLSVVHSRQRKYKGSDIERAWSVLIPEKCHCAKTKDKEVFITPVTTSTLAHRCALKITFFFF